VIFTDRPFRQGDYVLYNNIEGTIEDIGLRSTKIRTPYNSLVSVPNAHLADAAIDNLGMRVYRRLRTVASVTYDTPPEKIELFVEALRRFVHLHPDTWKENYLDILINVFFKVPSWSEELRARHQFLLGVLYIAEQLGISFAFPSQSIYDVEVRSSRSAASSKAGRNARRVATPTFPFRGKFVSFELAVGE